MTIKANPQLWILTGFLAGCGLAPGDLRAATYTVDRPDDEGTGTLREAIELANGNPGSDAIDFDLGGLGSMSIQPLTPLPVVTESVTIDGTTASGYDGRPVVEIDGQWLAAGEARALLELAGAESSVIRGLALNRSPGPGLRLLASHGSVIESCFVGTDLAGVQALPNLGSGIVLEGCSSGRVGGLSEAERNIISGNQGTGLILENSNDVRVQGNYIGVDLSGRKKLGNRLAGVHLRGRTSGNIVGGTETGAGNVISGNLSESAEAPGAVVLGSYSGGTPEAICTGNYVQGNQIGTDASGTLALNYEGTGVVLDPDSATNFIGGPFESARNIISANLIGIVVQESPGNVIQGNFIGVDGSGRQAMPNFFDGIRIVDSPHTVVGGTIAAARNVISGNGQDGVTIGNPGSTNNVLEGNYIGVDVTGTNALGNQRVGVLVTYISGSEVLSASQNRIGGTQPGSGNVISANGLGGVRIVQSTAAENAIQGNRIGTDATGSLALGNGSAAGIHLHNAPRNLIGGTEPGAGNLISGNAVGLRLTEPAALGNLIQGNRIGLAGDGVSGLPNVSHGVEIGNGASDNLVGGPSPDAANWIVANGGHGIWVESGTGNRLQRNVIVDNAGLGIDLAPEGVTANDLDDADLGANELQNYPTLESAVRLDGALRIRGELRTAPGRLCALEFFSNPLPDDSGYGEGELFLGTTELRSDETGFAAIEVTLPVDVPVGHWLSATATDEAGNTSEFSQCVQVTAEEVFFPLALHVSGGGSGRVVSQPAGIDCVGDCSAQFPEGAVVSLIAMPDADSVFVGWEGDGTGEPDRVVVMDGARTVVAVFERAGPGADLGVVASGAPNPVGIGGHLVFRTVITNGSGPVAEGVMVTNAMPAGADFVDASISRGTWARIDGTVVGSLGDLEGGGSATLTVELRPNLFGTLAHVASVGSQVPDPDPSNNQSSVEIRVLGPPLLLVPGPDGPGVSFWLQVPEHPGYATVVQSAEDLGPDTVWIDLPDAPHSGIITVLNEHPRRFYRAALDLSPEPGAAGSVP